MFSRIRLRPEDAAYYRFLWKEEGSEEFTTYQMNRLSFGDKCSPFVAIATIRRVADDHGAEKPEAVKAIKENMYMDDYLDSAKDLDEAVKRAKDVKQILAQGDFHFQEWVSNVPAFSAILNSESTITKDDQEIKVLGIRWNTELDHLSLVISGADHVIYNRFGISSFVSSIFDPLGFASPWIVKAKIKSRELSTRGVTWEEIIAEDDQTWWREWITSLNTINETAIPRCLFPDEELITSSELHVFNDASEEAFASVVYLRHTYLSGQVIIHLVIAKTKLAPKKVLSIPKLELQAALMGARLADYVTNSLTRPVARRRFWTDSSCVRNWIRSTAAYYKPFVSHRLGEIQVLTESSEWRFVPGRINCSDLATRSSIEIIPDVWFKGPEFLYQPEEEWPIDLPWMSVAEEIKSAQTFLAEVKVRPQMDWSSIQFGPNDLQNVIHGKPQHIEILQRCQEESFERELRRVKKSKELHSSSSLLSLTPFIGKNGLLRLGGRIGRAPLPYENLHQIILPGNHPLTDKIVDAFHRGYRHAGIEFILSRIREHFWVVGGKEAVRRARKGVWNVDGIDRKQLLSSWESFRSTAWNCTLRHSREPPSTISARFLLVLVGITRQNVMEF